MRSTKSTGMRFPNHIPNTVIWIYGWVYRYSVPMFAKTFTGWGTVEFNFLKPYFFTNDKTYGSDQRHHATDYKVNGEVFRLTEPALCNLIHRNSLIFCLGGGDAI